jgi:hypothetical protein
MTSLIPACELAEFLQLPADVRADIELWVKELCSVSKPIQKSLAAVAARMGVSLKTARRKYDAWREARHWRALLNRSKVPDERGLDREFIAYWQGLCKQNGRKCLPAYREFVRQFKAGEPIPGIDVTVCRKKLPLGYSYDNLIRHRPSDLELNAARIGRSAAADYRPKNFTSRVGMAVGQRFIFDDLWHDFKVVTLGQRRPMRLLQLHAHDLYSACNFARGLKPRLEDEATGKSVGLKENEMLFLVAHVLAEYGFHPDGCALMVEHGTAAIREDLERILFDLTAGRVTVERSGIEGAAAFAGQYCGASKGNFRFKAALESSGNLIHNETANLIQFPGQTGSNSRLNKPEELHGRERHAEALIKAMTALPAERAAMLRLPFLEVNQAKWLVEEVMERINQRTEHDLEGWVDAGLTTMDFELPDIGIISAQKFLALPVEKQAALQAIATPAPRKMSPREVFDAGRSRLMRLRPEQTAMLLRDVAGREVSVGKDHLITFDDETISPAPLRYLAHHFAPGDTFTAVVNPMSPHTAHLFNGRGGWVGVVTAWQTIRRDDVEGLTRQLGAARKVESELLTPLAATGARMIKDRIEAAQHNAAVMDRSKPLTDAEKSLAQFVASEGKDAAEDILRPAGEAPAIETNMDAADELLRAMTKK